ncbi:MAG: 50S ribosomal protein L19e [Candidatus Anstonellales archaeon]
MISTTKRIAADMLGVGVNRIRIKPEGLERAEHALTREDVRGLIKEKLVYALPVHPKRTERRVRRKRAGSRKGAKHTRSGRKAKWMAKIRSQRAFIAKLFKEGKIDRKAKNLLFLKAKGNAFKGKKALLHYAQENKLIIGEGK